MTYDHQNLTMTRGDIADMQQLLTEQRTRRLDVVTGADALSYVHGQLRVQTSEQAITEDGVTAISGLYRPSRQFDNTFSAKLGMPGGVARKWREENRLELLDFAVNNYLHGSQDTIRGYDSPAYGENLMLRLFTGIDGGGGIARAALSDKYKPVDNLDVLVSALQGIEAAGVPVEIGRCDVTSDRMYVQVKAPSVAVLAPELLKGYRSPYTGAVADENPVVFAGFVISNAELGDGALRIVPRITVKVCDNGMTWSADALRAIHLGTKHSEGIVTYAADTVEKELELVKLRVRDAVATFLNADYVTAKVRELEEQAGIEITRPEETIRQVVAATAIPQALADDVLNRFIKGAQGTAGGVAQAVTAVAQDQDDADLAYELEDKAGAVLAAAARLA